MVHYHYNEFLDPYQRAEGKETVLHWACQCKTKNDKILQLLLAFTNDEWVLDVHVTDVQNHYVLSSAYVYKLESGG